MGAAPKNWELSQPPGAGGRGEPLAPSTGRIGAGLTLGAGELIAAPGEWRWPERLGVGGKITLEVTVFGIVQRHPF